MKTMKLQGWGQWLDMHRYFLCHSSVHIWGPSLNSYLNQFLIFEVLEWPPNQDIKGLDNPQQCACKVLALATRWGYR